MLRRFISASPAWLQDIIAAVWGQRAIAKWERAGQPVPPPYEVKRRTINEYREQFHCAILVETGTYWGDTVAAMRRKFEKVISIELSEDFYQRAVRRFRNAGNVELHHGDSGEVLKKIVPQLQAPTLFWLDGHYSGGPTAQGQKDSPIIEELETIFAMRKFQHVVLIDDAREFVGQNGYPELEELRELIEKRFGYYFEVKHDIIRATPGAPTVSDPQPVQPVAPFRPQANPV